jgi:hypothetical protein
MFTEPEVIIAVITTVGVLGASVLPSWISNGKKTQRVADTLGEPNGHGTIASMLEEMLSLLQDHGRRITRLEEKVDFYHGQQSTD